MSYDKLRMHSHFLTTVYDMCDAIEEEKVPQEDLEAIHTWPDLENTMTFEEYLMLTEFCEEGYIDNKESMNYWLTFLRSITGTPAVVTQWLRDQSKETIQ